MAENGPQADAYRKGPNGGPVFLLHPYDVVALIQKFRQADMVIAEHLTKIVKHINREYVAPQCSEAQRWDGRPSFLRLRESELPSKGASLSACHAPARGWKRPLLLLACLAVLSALSYDLVNRFVVPSLIVRGDSMTPTLQEGQRVLLNRWSYLRRLPQRGDLVVMKSVGEQYYSIRRVLALPCESVHFRGGEILVNGKPLPEPYLPSGTGGFLQDLQERLLVVGKDH